MSKLRAGIMTIGAPVALELRVDSAGCVADGCDVALLTCVCADAQGREAPDMEALIHFDVNGLGELLGTGSDICDHTPVTCPDRRMRAGRCALCVRVGKEGGALTVSAHAVGLVGAHVRIDLNAVLT